MSRDIFARFPAVRRVVYQSIFTIMPRLPMRPCQFLGQMIGEVVAFIDRAGSKRVAKNIAPLLPQQHKRDNRWWVRRNYRRFCQGMFEQLHLDRIPLSASRPPALSITDPWKALGDDPYDQQEISGPGVYILPHCNWELLPAILKPLQKVDTIHAIALSHGDQAIDELFNRIRKRVHVHTHLLHQAPLASLRALQQGAIFGLIGDRDYTRHGIEVKINGAQCSLPIGPAAMAVQSKTALQPIAFFRNGHTRFHLIFGKPIQIPPDCSKKEAVKAMTQASAAWYQRVLPCACDQWVVFHSVWQSPSTTTTDNRE